MRGLARCLLFDGVGSTQSSIVSKDSPSCDWLSQILSEVLPHSEHLMGKPEPELRIVLPQQTGRDVILGTESRIDSLSKWIELSGAVRPTHEIISPGCRVLNNLLTGPPSLKATSLAALPPTDTMTLECAPLVCSG